MYNALSSKVAFDNLEDSLSGTLSVYPVAADAVVATSHASAWNRTGAFAEVVPVSTITHDIWLESIVVEATANVDTFLLDVSTGLVGAEVVIASVRVNITHVNNTNDVRIPIRKKIPANTRINVRSTCKSANAYTASVSISYRAVA